MGLRRYHSRFPILQGVLFTLSLACCTDAWAEPTWVASKRLFRREVERAKKVFVLNAAQAGKLRPLHRALGWGRDVRLLLAPLKAGFGSSVKRARRRFSKDQILRVQVGEVELAMETKGGRVKTLEVSSKTRKRSLLPTDTPVIIDETNGAMVPALGDPKLAWIGPLNRLQLLAYLHEHGHTKHYTSLSENDLNRLGGAVAMLTLGMPLTEEQKRMILGAERMGWAEAFRTLRTLRAEGIPLLGAVSNRTLRKFAGAMLGGYAKALGLMPEQPEQ